MAVLLVAAVLSIHANCGPVLFLLQMDLEGFRRHGQLARHNHNYMI
jgi:hypothetical protein